MTHVWEEGVRDRVCVLRSLLQEKTFRQSAVPKHLYVRMYRFVCLIVLIYLYNVLYISKYCLVFLCVCNVTLFEYCQMVTKRIKDDYDYS